MIERLTTWIGKTSSWVSVFLVFIICLDVLLRYCFNNTQSWIIELEWHLFALIFLLGGAYALKADQHVRVDVWYTKRTAKTKAWVNLLGTVLFLIPWCLIIIYTSYNYAENSWAIGESSPDPGGLPARYIIKFAIPVGFSLLFLQALSLISTSIREIRKPTIAAS